MHCQTNSQTYSLQLIVICLVAHVAVARWTEWTSWTECNKPCGIGIASSTRSCSNFTNNCIGKNIRYKTCNVQDCVEHDVNNTRQKQCAVFNHNVYNGVNHIWIPFQNSTLPSCALYCQAIGTKTVKLLSEKVLDGTGCFDDAGGICVDGQCERIGCDGKLNSGKKFDICGVCDGDAASCRLVTGLYRFETNKTEGTEIITTIPQRSRHISISKRGHGQLGLKLTNSTEVNIVSRNRNNSHQLPSVHINYEKLPNDKEYFDVSGPIDKDIQLMALYDTSAFKYIRYEFYRPLKAVWIHNQTAVDCSKTCGSGLRFIKPVCVDVATKKIVDGEVCVNEGLSSPAPKVYRCNVEPCKTSYFKERRFFTFENARKSRWVPDPWTECSVSCNGGFQTRTVSCMEDTEDGKSYTSIDDAPCLKAFHSAPKKWQKCNEHPCPQWIPGPWLPCSATCGNGVQRRIKKCVAFDGSPAHRCDGRQLEITRHCFGDQLCRGQRIELINDQHQKQIGQNAFFKATITSISLQPSWKSGRWSACSATCGRGVKRRIVECQMLSEYSRNLENLPESNCEAEVKPEQTMPCMLKMCNRSNTNETDDVDHQLLDLSSVRIEEDFVDVTISQIPKFQISKNTNFEWRLEEYDACVPFCNGNTTIDYRCYHIDSELIVANENCDSLAKPCVGSSCRSSTQEYNSGWHLGLFGPCSVTCGRGTQHRTVVCRNLPEGPSNSDFHRIVVDERLPEIMCPSPRPEAVRDCLQTSCPARWVVSEWNQCSQSCGRGFQNRKIFCKQRQGNGDDIKIPYSYCNGKLPTERRVCIVRRNCPPQSSRRAWKSCFPNCKSRSHNIKAGCYQVQAGRIKPKRRSQTKCLHSMNSSSRKRCNSKRCVRRRRPKIYSKREEIVQDHHQTKLWVVIGQRATVYPNTKLTIKCRTGRFPKGALKWYYNGTLIGVGAKWKSKLTNRIYSKSIGFLIINGVKEKDSGFYACVAGSTKSRSLIKVVEAPMKISNSSNNLFRTSSKSSKPRINEQTGVINDVDELLHSAQAQSVSRLVFHPDISNVEAENVLQTDAFSSNNGKISNSVVEHLIEVEADGDIDDLQIIDQIQNFLTQHSSNSSLEAINEKLQQILDIRSSESFTEVPQTNRIRNILNELVVLSGNVTQNDRLFQEKESANNKIYRFLQLLKTQLQISPSFEPPQIATFPTISTIYREVDVTAYVGGTLTMTQAERVTILCETVSKTDSEITWFRNGHEINGDDRVLILQEGSLRILNPRFDDSGIYTCSASNIYGKDSKNTSLTVMRKPRIRSITESHKDFDSEVVDVIIGSNIKARLGGKIVIRCPTEGYPDSYVSWTKDGAGLGHNTKILPDNSLQIFPSTEADQGLFGCEASNPAGSDYQASSLILIDPPHMMDELDFVASFEDGTGLPEFLQTSLIPENYLIKNSASVLIACPVTGYPQPQITWTFNNQSLDELGPILDYQLLENNRILHIPNFNRETEGTYSCNARNDAGNLTSSLTLTLTVFSYGFRELSTCSASCGPTGVQFHNIHCLQDGVVEVDEWHCNGMARPSLKAIQCNRIDCPPRMAYGNWSPCSSSCGKGMRVRHPVCTVLKSDGSTQEVYRNACSLASNFSVEREECQLNICSFWKTGPWSNCSRKCVKRGKTGRIRKVFCVASNGTRLGETFCSSTKPKRTSICRSQLCIPVWVVSRWSSCSKSCGNSGIRTRVTKCIYKGIHQSATGQCLSRRKPVTKLPCNRRSCSASNTRKFCAARYTRCKSAKNRRNCIAKLRKICSQSRRR